MWPKRMKLVGDHSPDGQDEKREKRQPQTKKQPRQTYKSDIVEDRIHSRDVGFGYDCTAEGCIETQNQRRSRIIPRREVRDRQETVSLTNRQDGLRCSRAIGALHPYGGRGPGMLELASLVQGKKEGRNEKQHQSRQEQRDRDRPAVQSCNELAQRFSPFQDTLLMTGAALRLAAALTIDVGDRASGAAFRNILIVNSRPGHDLARWSPSYPQCRTFEDIASCR